MVELVKETEKPNFSIRTIRFTYSNEVRLPSNLTYGKLCLLANMLLCALTESETTLYFL